MIQGELGAMGRIGSTKELKPHEKVLMHLGMDEGLNKLVLAMLGISDRKPCELQDLLTEPALKDQPIKQLHNVRGTFPIQALGVLPNINLAYSSTHISGNWVEDGNQFRMASDRSYDSALYESICAIYPDINSCSELVPVTLLLPSDVRADVSSLSDARSDWQFIRIGDETEDRPEGRRYGLDYYSTATDELYALRFYLAFKFLGLVDVKHDPRSSKVLFLQILTALGMRDHLDLIDRVQLSKWTKDNRDKLIRGEEVKLDYEKLRSTIGPEISPKAFYYTAPLYRHPKILKAIENNDSEMIYFPFLTCKKSVSSPFQDVNLGSQKAKDRKSLKHATSNMRTMLAYLCSMTSGTAITFNVPVLKKEGERKTTGITSPTLILPAAWNELALSHKGVRPGGEFIAMSDDEDDDSDERANFRNAIYANYYTKQDELLREIPGLPCWGDAHLTCDFSARNN